MLKEFQKLQPDVQRAILKTIDLLEKEGPNLKEPHSKPLQAGDHIRELRVNHRNNQWRALYRNCSGASVLLLIFNKKGAEKSKFNKKMQLAEGRADAHERCENAIPLADAGLR